MSNRLYDIINTFNKLVAKDEPKQTITESAKPKTKLEETMAKVESEFQTFKEGKKAKPDFLDVDKDGNKKEPFKKAVKDKEVKESAKPDYIDLDKDGNKKETMKKAAKDKAAKVDENKTLVSGRPLGIRDMLTPFYYNTIAKYLKANGLKSVKQFSGEDVDALATKLGVSMDAIAGLVDFTEEEFNEAQDLVSGQPLGINAKLTPFYYNAIAKYLKASGLQSVAQFSSEDIDVLSSKLGVSMEALADLVGFEEVKEAAENPYQQRILDSDPETLAKFLETGYIDTTSDLYYNMYEYYANQMPDRVRRNMDQQYDFITAKIREVAGGVNESAAPGQEAWIKKNKERFVKQYGKKKGMEVLYATAWKRSKNEDAHDAEISEEDPVFEGDDYWDFKDLKDTPTSGTRKVAGTRYGGSAQKDDDDEEESNTKPAGEKRGRGRPKGPGKKMGAKGPTGKSKLMKETSGDSLGEIAEDLQHVVDRLSDIGEVELAKHLQPIVWDLDDRDPLDEGDYGWDYPEEKSKAPTSRKVSGTRYGGSAQKDDDEDEDDIGTTKADAPKRGRGRPKGSGKKLGSRGPTGRSKLMKESRPSLMDRLLDETYAMFGEDNTELTLDQDQLRQHIGDNNFEQLRQAMTTQGSFPESMYDALYDYFSETGEMPYGAATAEDEDPFNWIHQKLDQMFSDDTSGEDYGTFGDDERPGEDEMNAESVNENKQMVAESMQQIVHSYPHEIKRFVNTGEMDNDLYSALFDYYFNAGEMPYGTAKGRDGDPMEWVSMRFDQDVQELQLEENSPEFMRSPAVATTPAPAVSTPVGQVDGLDAELNELARLAGLKESIGECGEMSPFTQAGQPEQPSGMSINTNIDTRTGTKTMTVTADGDVADKLAEILSLSGLAGQVTARSSEVVGQEVPQEPEMQVVAVGEDTDAVRDKFRASTTPDPEVASVDAIIDQGDDLNRKKKQHADKPKLGDNPLATEGISLSKSLMRELESIKVKK